MCRLRSRIVLLAAVVAFSAVATAALAACSSDEDAAPPSTSAEATTTTAARPEDPVDELIPVRGARMHLHCDGSGDTTVVLIAGFTDGGDQWGQMQTSLAETARVCAYARFGTGPSDPAPSDQTFETQAEDLHALLDTAGEPGPFVLVGHSFGGPVAVTFADHYSDEVRGLALVDASPPGWYDAVCSVPDDGSDAAHGFLELCASLTDPAGNPERLDGSDAFADVGTIDGLDALPMTVITASERSLFPGTAAAEVERLNDLWDAGQQDWAELSSSSELTTVEGVGHYIHHDRPDLVLEQIQQLLP